jgi:hypothetical protein
MHDMELKPKPARGNLRLSRIGLGSHGIGWIDEERHGAGVGYQFVQQLQQFRRQLHMQRGHPGHVAARLAKAGDQSTLDRVIRYLEDDRNRRGRRLGSECRREAGKRNHAHLATNQIGGQRR